jgi:hypothetical protein
MWVEVIYFVHPSFIAFFTSLHNIYDITMEMFVSQSWKLTDNCMQLSVPSFCFENISVLNEMKKKVHVFEKRYNIFIEFELRTRSPVCTLYSKNKTIFTTF